eukprot:g1174.t1
MHASPPSVAAQPQTLTTKRPAGQIAAAPAQPKKKSKLSPVPVPAASPSVDAKDAISGSGSDSDSDSDDEELSLSELLQQKKRQLQEASERTFATATAETSRPNSTMQIVPDGAGESTDSPNVVGLATSGAPPTTNKSRQFQRAMSSAAMRVKEAPVVQRYQSRRDARKSRRDKKREAHCNAQMASLTSRSDMRLVDSDTVTKLFAAEDGTRSERAIRQFNRDLLPGKDEVSIAEVQSLLKQTEHGALTEPERILAEDIVNLSIREQLTRVENYANLIAFVLFYAAYIFVIYSANATPEMAFDIQNAMETQLLMHGGMPVQPFGSRDQIFHWMHTKIFPLYRDPTCGNGRCDAPVEYKQWGPSGCMADCGYYSEKTNATLNIEVNFTKHLMLGEWTQNEWTNVAWTIDSPVTHQGLSAYNATQELRQQYLPIGTEVKVRTADVVGAVLQGFWDSYSPGSPDKCPMNRSACEPSYFVVSRQPGPNTAHDDATDSLYTLSTTDPTAVSSGTTDKASTPSVSGPRRLNSAAELQGVPISDLDVLVAKFELTEFPYRPPESERLSIIDGNWQLRVFAKKGGVKASLVGMNVEKEAVYNCSEPTLHGKSICRGQSVYGTDAALPVQSCGALDANGNSTQCVFPFVFENELHSSCTFAGDEQFMWCATAVDAKGVVTTKGVCISCEGDHNCNTLSVAPALPTLMPTPTPTSVPTAAPSAVPTFTPTDGPSASPTDMPTATPTDAPTETPTDAGDDPTQVFQVHMDPGGYPSEVSWRIDDAVPSGFTDMQEVTLTPGEHTLDMIDSFGDGWNGASWTLKQDDTTIAGPFTFYYGGEGHTIVEVARQINETLASISGDTELQPLISSVSLRFSGLGLACVDQKLFLVTEVLAQAIQKPTVSVTIVDVTASEGQASSVEDVVVEYWIRTHTTLSHETIMQLGTDETCVKDPGKRCTATPTPEFKREVSRTANRLLQPFFWTGKVQVEALVTKHDASTDGVSAWQCEEGHSCAVRTALNFSGDTSDYGYMRYDRQINESSWQSERGCSCKLGGRLNFYAHVNLDALEDTATPLPLQNSDNLQILGGINVALWDWRFPKDELQTFLQDEEWHSYGLYEDGLVYMTRIDPTNLLEHYLGKYDALENASSLPEGYTEQSASGAGVQKYEYAFTMGYSNYASEQSWGIDLEDGEADCNANGRLDVAWTSDHSEPILLTPGEHTISLCDSYGDGWTPSSSSFVTVTNGLGTTISTHAMTADRYEEQQFTVPEDPTMETYTVPPEQWWIPMRPLSPTERVSESVFATQIAVQGSCANIGAFGNSEWGVRLERGTEQVELAAENLAWSAGVNPTGDQWRETCIGEYNCHEPNIVCGACSREEDDAYRLQLTSASERECAEGCTNSMLANGACESACFVASCDFDFGDCKLPSETAYASVPFMVRNFNKDASFVDYLGSPVDSSVAAGRRLKAGGSSASTVTKASGGGGSGSMSSAQGSGSMYGSSDSRTAGSVDKDGLYLGIKPFVDKLKPRYRLLGLKNTIIGGVLIKLKRSKALPCPRNSFFELQRECVGSVEQDEPYGADGAFMEASSLYNPLLLARMDEFYADPDIKAYNATSLINPVTSMPYGFEYKAAPQNAGGSAASGFHIFLDVSFTEDKVTRLLQYMEDGFFIDQASSELKVSCLCYNGEAEVFTMAIFTFDFSPSGPLKISPYFTTFAVPNYDDNAGRFRLFCEIAIIILICLNIYGEMYEMRQVGVYSYVTNFWNAVDIANCVLVLVLAFSWMAFYHNKLKLFAPSPRYYVYYDLEAPAHPLALNYSDTT